MNEAVNVDAVTDICPEQQRNKVVNSSRVSGLITGWDDQVSTGPEQQNTEFL